MCKRTQQLPTLLGQQCWELLRPFARAWKFVRFQTQQHAITCNRVCKRTQHVTSTNVGRCWPKLLLPFARGFRVVKHSLNYAQTGMITGPLPDDLCLPHKEISPPTFFHLLIFTRTKFKYYLFKSFAFLLNCHSTVAAEYNLP